jgi:osmotically-inducible protein OsmY
LCVLAIVLLLPGCFPLSLLVGAGAAVEVAAAQEGGVKAAAADAGIKLKIADLWVRNDFDLYRKLNITVKEGRVLVTGSVPNPDKRVDAIRLVWQVDGVKQVLNEVTVDGGNKDNVAAVTGTVSDALITSNLKTRLMLDKYVESINYTIDTANGTVYLMGVAQDQRELERVINYARNASYVSNVVSYVRLRQDAQNTAAQTVMN